MWLCSPRSSSRQLVQRFEMIIDTGRTDEIWVTPVMMDAVVSELESHGPRIPALRIAHYPSLTQRKFSSCELCLEDSVRYTTAPSLPGQ